MPTSARTSLGFFGQFADVGIRAPEQNGLLQQALARTAPKTAREALAFPSRNKNTGKHHAFAMRLVRNGSQDTLSRDALDTADKSVERRTSRWPGHAPSEQDGTVWTETFRAANCFVCGSR